jgi:hypothetical protein
VKIMMRDGRVFQGTARQIVQAMQDIAMPAQHLSLAEYMAWVAENALRFEGVELRHDGETDEERAKSLVASMLEAELAVEM